MASDPDEGLPPVPFPIRTDFPTPISARVEWELFTEYHAWALSTLMGVTLRTAASRPWYSHLERGWLFLHVVVAPVVRGRDTNPANSWFLRDVYLHSLEQMIRENPGLERKNIAENTQYQAMFARFKESHGARFGGLLNVGYRLGIGNLATEGFRPVFVPHHPENLLLPETQDALEDLARLCQMCINNGIVLKPTSREETSAVPGTLRPVTSKSKTTWEWTPLLNTLDDVYEGFKRYGYVPKSTLSSRELMDLNATL